MYLVVLCVDTYLQLKIFCFGCTHLLVCLGIVISLRELSSHASHEHPIMGVGPGCYYSKGRGVLLSPFQCTGDETNCLKSMVCDAEKIVKYDGTRGPPLCCDSFLEQDGLGAKDPAPIRSVGVMCFAWKGATG